jgi:CRP-like cAMP-binding protein
MKNSLENFKPKLRAGRVIPQGSRFVFETDNPYNQIVLPMALADLVLLCSGQFTVRQIMEKMYRKQGAVPFKWILSALHSLHQGGFFENSEELTLSSQLENWVAPKTSRWHLSWRFGQRIVTDQLSPASFYALTLVLLVLSILGLQHFPASPFKMVEAWVQENDLFTCLWSLFAISSVVQTIRYIFCGIQLLLLTGKAYNVSVRLSPWGLHLHVGDESNGLFENRLYTSMFHISQIMAPWAVVFLGAFVTDPSNLKGLGIVALLTTMWELNPFANSDGRKFLKDLMMPADRDVVSWHFDKSTVINTLRPGMRQRDHDFARICAIWGSLWLFMALAVLHECAAFFGPDVLSHVLNWGPTSWSRAVGLTLWLGALYFLVQALVEKVLVSALGPYWSEFKIGFTKIAGNPKAQWDPKTIRQSVEDLPLFSHFHEQFLDVIIGQSEVLALKKGTSVIRANEDLREIYVLLEGSVEVSRIDGADSAEWVSELGSVSIFGESSLIDGTRQMTSVNAKTDCVLLKVRVSSLREAAQEAGTVRHLEDFRNAILVNQFFASSPVFRSLSQESIDFLCSRGTLEYFNLGQCVFEQGAAGDSLFLILRGSVDVFVHGNGIKPLYQGSFFGEIALIANIPRTATIMTREPSVFFKLSADSFWEVLVQHLDLGVFIETISESRLREDLEIVQSTRTGSDSN